MSRGVAGLTSALTFLFALAVTAVSAAACEGGGTEPICGFPYCESTITPGVKIKVELDEVINSCTAGPIMKNGTELFLLTAGHCFFEDEEEEGSGTVTKEVKSLYPNGAKPEKKIGKTGTFTDTKEYDVAEVKIENAEWLLKAGGAPAVLVEWGTPPKIATVIGKALNKVGEETCFSGSASGLHCGGKILRTGATSPGGVKNLVETSINGEGGDSGAPEFAPGKGVLIQGIYIKKGSDAKTGNGKLTVNSEKIMGFPLEPGNTCTEITEMKAKWTVPIEGEGIPAGATVVGCAEVAGTPPTATITMSAKAEKTKEVKVTFGRKELGWYEPMLQIEAKYPGQLLLSQ